MGFLLAAWRDVGALEYLRDGERRGVVAGPEDFVVLAVHAPRGGPNSRATEPFAMTRLDLRQSGSRIVGQYEEVDLAGPNVVPINLVSVAEEFIERVLERNQGVEVLEGVLGELDNELMIGHALTLGGVQQPLDMCSSPATSAPPAADPEGC